MPSSGLGASGGAGGDQQSPPVPLRNGISVQELKQMTALRMAQSQDMWQKQTGAQPGTTAAKPQAEATSIREPTPPPANTSAGGTPSAPHMPHGLTVQELKELTRMRLAREKLTQEEVSKVQVARDALTAYRQSLYPDSEESNGPMTDHQMFTMLQEMDPQSQKDLPLHSEPVTELAAKAMGASAASAGVSKDKGSQNSLFSLRRLALENRISEIEDKASELDVIPGPPPSPKSLRSRPKLAVSCPQPVRKRSASDSNDLPYEVAESVLLTPTGVSPHRKTFGSPRVASNKTAQHIVDHETPAKTFEQTFVPDVPEPDEGWRTARVTEASPRLYWAAPDKPAANGNGQSYEDVPPPPPRYQHIDARAFVRAGKSGLNPVPGYSSFGNSMYNTGDSVSLTPTTIDENLVYYTGNPYGDDADYEQPAGLEAGWQTRAPAYAHNYGQVPLAQHMSVHNADGQYGYPPQRQTRAGANLNVHGGMGFTPSLH